MARTIYAQEAEKYIPALAEALKKIPEFEVPEWAEFVKTGVSRSRPPVQTDFWYTRAASILRQLYIHGVVGVGRLRTRYGTKCNRGGKPSKFMKASGKIIRTILQQAEKAGLIEKVTRLQFGRRLTQAGRDLLDSINVGEGKDLELQKAVVHTLPTPNIQEETEEESVEAENLETEGKNAEDEAKPAKEKAAEDAPKGVPQDKELGGKDGE